MDVFVHRGSRKKEDESFISDSVSLMEANYAFNEPYDCSLKCIKGVRINMDDSLSMFFSPDILLTMNQLVQHEYFHHVFSKIDNIQVNPRKNFRYFE